MDDPNSYPEVLRSHDLYAEAALHKGDPSSSSGFEKTPDHLLEPGVQNWEHQLHKRLAVEIQDADQKVRNAQRCAAMYQKEAHSLERTLRHRARDIEDVRMEIAKPVTEAEDLRRRIAATRKATRELDAQKVTQEMEAAVAQARRETQELYNKASRECQELREEGIREKTRCHQVSGACDARVRSAAAIVDGSFRKILALWGGPSDELAVEGVPNEPVVRWFDALRRLLKRSLEEVLVADESPVTETKEGEDIVLAREAAAGAVESWRLMRVRAAASTPEITHEKTLRSEIHFCRERVESLENALAAQRRATAALATTLDAEKSRRRAVQQEQRSLVSLAAELLEDAEKENLESQAAVARAKRRGVAAHKHMEQQKKKFQEILRRNLGAESVSKGTGATKSKRAKSR